MSKWTEERIELLRRLWIEGRSATQVAAELGEGVTRNAVIGKVHRLKISAEAGARATRSVGRKKSDTPRARKTTPKAVTSSQRIAVRSAANMAGAALEKIDGHELVADIAFVLPPTENFGGVQALMGRAESDCRWPVGDVKAADFRLCGTHITTKGFAYCNHHQAKAYQKDDRRARSVVGARTGAPTRQFPNFF